MEKVVAPIPAFYACYLLRSIAHHASLYVGSTPNPPRRLRQHNGDAKGGAVRTSRPSLRPWEMTCLVTGFPSKVAALQFEWAWQNPNLTRHVSPGSRITQSRMLSRISPRTGKVRKRAARPRLSLTDRLAHLRLLLNAKSFGRWPLKLTFFSEDVYRVWQRAQDASDALRPGIEIAMDETSRGIPATARADNPSLPANAVGIHALDIGYSSLKPQLEKSQATFSNEKGSTCAVCRQSTPSNGAATLMCPNPACSSCSHMQCLASVFLKNEGADPETIVPTTGKCPSCSEKLRWVDLVKDLSLRMRGEKEVKVLFKSKRGRKATSSKESATEVLEIPESCSESEDIGEGDESEGEDDDPIDMVLDEQDESSGDETAASNVRSDPSPLKTSSGFRLPAWPIPAFSKPVIEESDDEDRRQR